MAIHSNPYKNKQSISERMRRFAVQYFGISRVELLDPVVNLLLEALAEEVNKAAASLEASEKRISDKLSSLLASGMDAIAQPAHAIIHSAAAESVVELTAQTEFRCNYNSKTFDFYPAVNACLYKGDVRYFIHNEYMYAVNADQTHTLLTRSGKKDPARNSVFWIGIELDDAVENLTNISFYIDFQGIYNKEKYLNLLTHSRWYVHDVELSPVQGIYSVDEKHDNDTLAFFSPYDVSRKINKRVKEIYNPHFLSVNSDIPVHNKEIFPAGLKSVFSEQVSSRIDRPLLWIKVHCPSEFSTEIMNAMKISINAFPAVNKKLIKKTVSVHRRMPVIPLDTGSNESFISIASLSDSHGRQYYDIPVNDTENTRYGIYSLSRGGCETFSRREALEFLSLMTDEISGEVSFFFKNQNDVNSGLRKISGEANMLVRDLDKIMSGIKERMEVKNYLLPDMEIDEEIYFLLYWTTSGAEANGIPPGTLMRVSSEPSLQPASIRTLSTVRGGKHAPQSIEKEHAHKKALSEHTLLITGEDIVRFCNDRFKDVVSDVRVKKGVMQSGDPRTGFIRTTDVYMTLRKEMKKYVQDGSGFEQILKANSPETYRYRVFIN
ncbi:MAG: hypothetical protein LBJ63_02145 [Prevotellaceae bacterium]|jgi:hypothetical protein|nr:hypothetical protein [Prevotellaceae bacterium]